MPLNLADPEEMPVYKLSDAQMTIRIVGFVWHTSSPGMNLRKFPGSRPVTKRW
jgi:hypothetical protein